MEDESLACHHAIVTINAFIVNKTSITARFLRTTKVPPSGRTSGRKKIAREIPREFGTVTKSITAHSPHVLVLRVGGS